ncbi:hypothetical protein [Alloalcanivorax mobilis]|uniref:hypothetical protein n=1 Tax=Alloalcanivorax mobilis TaxID=2019569 RepID=UPI0012FFFD98|nr:hypothetical protein [Alloalcanivorax mobilis]
MCGYSADNWPNRVDVYSTAETVPDHKKAAKVLLRRHHPAAFKKRKKKIKPFPSNTCKQHSNDRIGLEKIGGIQRIYPPLTDHDNATK